MALVSFFNEKLDLAVDGQNLERPVRWPGMCGHLSRWRMGRERARAIWWLAAVGGVALAGCGSSLSSGQAARAGSFDSATVVSSTSCSVSGTEKTQNVVHPCVFVLGDGRRLPCPPAYARAVQSADTLEHAKACTRLRPLAIPASWRPVLAALQKAGSCLTRQGWRVSGGPSLGDPYRRAETPIGELQVHNGTARSSSGITRAQTLPGNSTPPRSGMSSPGADSSSDTAT